jgi:hypothetical protein
VTSPASPLPLSHQRRAIRPAAAVSALTLFPRALRVQFVPDGTACRVVLRVLFRVPGEPCRLIDSVIDGFFCHQSRAMRGSSSSLCRDLRQRFSE